jgi:hypothetical protein
MMTLLTLGSHSLYERKEGAGRHQSDDEIDIYDQAARQIRLGLDAYAVSVVDPSFFSPRPQKHHPSSTLCLVHPNRPM